MATHPQNKYHLKDLHDEISYYDRKISYAQELEKFETEEARAKELKRLNTRRATLVKAAGNMVASGIEYNPQDLPRSLKPTEA
ncbi:MAG TPA: hypothetical protein VMT82_10310 [candidate division Zixibacteria bacterium]|nr:hypothetical protein [candidate division Zixibacteria bacterium]